MASGGIVAYYRVSTEKQGASGLGLEAQRATVERYLNGGKWHVVGEFTEIESGRNSDQPALGQALAAARLHRVPLVVAKAWVAPMRTVLYARVSTADQTLDRQRTQAEAAGFKIDTVVADHGVSGVSTKLAERPQGKRLFDMLRSGDTLVVRWVDRLGRNYQDVSDTIREFIRRGVVIRTVINDMTFDGATKDPIQKAVRDALIDFMAATAEAQAETTKAAQRAGIEHAKASGERYKGRKPSFSRSQFETVRDLLGQDAGVSVIAQTTGLSRQTIYRIREDAVGSEAALANWGQ